MFESGISEEGVLRRRKEEGLDSMNDCREKSNIKVK
jgi:hypothetical protein